MVRRVSPGGAVLLAVAALTGIVLVDAVLALRHWPLPVVGGLDEAAHLLTAGLVLAAVLPARARRSVPWVLAGAVVIDADHVPLYLWNALTVEGNERPVTHSLGTVAALLAVGCVCRGRPRAALLGLSGGVALHLLRDLGTGPGVPLGWPVDPARAQVPYAAYLATMLVAVLGVAVRRLLDGRRAPGRAPGARGPGRTTVSAAGVRVHVRHVTLPRSAGDDGVDAVAARRAALRAELRRLAGEVLGIHPAAVPLAERPGRPALAGSAPFRDVDLSVSASGEVGLVAVARGGRIGVDVQRIGDEDVETAVAEGWLSERERRSVASLPPGHRPRALTRAWVQKEAVLKGQGVGLQADLTAIVTPVADTGRIDGWRLAPIPVADGYVACVGYRPRPLRVRLRSALTRR